MKRRAFLGAVLGALAIKTPARRMVRTAPHTAKPIGLVFHRQAFRYSHTLTSYYNPKTDQVVTRLDVMAGWPIQSEHAPVVIYG